MYGLSMYFLFHSHFVSARDRVSENPFQTSVLFICLTDLKYVHEWNKSMIAANSLCNENVNSTKMSQLFIVLTPTIQ